MSSYFNNSSMSGSWTKLGSDNNFTGATGVGGTDWGSMPDLNEGFGGGKFDVDKTGLSFGGGSKTDLLKAAGVFGSLLSKAGGNKYREKAEQGGPRVLGDPMGGKAGQVLDNLGVVFPQQHAPIFIPGVQNQGGKGVGQRIAGGLGGALQGAAMGSAFGPIGTVGGALIGGFGGAM
jgi:hypothetical protein